MNKPTYAEQTFAIEFGRRLKAARGKVSQCSLADALGVHRNQIWRWESGDSQVDLLMAMRIVGVLRCDMNTLMPGTAFVWGREAPRCPQGRRKTTLSQAVAERDPPLTAKERA